MRDLVPARHILQAIGQSMGLDIPKGAALRSTVFKDNNGCLTLATVPKMTPRTMVLGVKYFWFRSHVGPGSGIKIIKAASENQLADTFTKGLALEQFRILRQKLMGWTAEAREGVSKVELTKYLWSLLGTARLGQSPANAPRTKCANWAGGDILRALLAYRY
jgi:hypothetical protein